MPCASARRRAAAAGSWPGSSLSGRLLTIVRTPDAASASISPDPSAPAALSPGASSARGGSEGIKRLLRNLPRDAQADAARSPEKIPYERSGSELSRPLHKAAGADPEPLEPAQGRHDGLQIGLGDRRLAEHLDVAAMHAGQPVAQGAPLICEPDMDRSAVMHRALLHQIAVLDHFLDVVGNVRAEIAAAQRQLADGHLGIPDIKQHHALHVVNVVDAEPVELELNDFEKMSVKPLDQRNHL